MRRTFFNFLLALMISCSPGEIKTFRDVYPPLFPDYTEVIIPYNIAPLNFGVKEASRIRVEIYVEGKLKLKLTGQSYINIPRKKWSELLQFNKGRNLMVRVSVWCDMYPDGVTYKPFPIFVSTEEIDEWIAYRLIEPGYELWNQMGIYQRNLSSFTEKEIIVNTQNHGGCLNCHSFHNYSPEIFLFHSRGTVATTVLIKDGVTGRLDLNKMDNGMNPTYPAWHPSGNYIAFSSNDIHQSFYHFGNTPVEVYDLSSDLMIYDIKNNRILTDDRFTNVSYFETFPAFSPDGRYLYFCRAEAKKMPMEYQELKYSLYRINFDISTGELGAITDTLYDASAMDGSVSFPRISPDGNYLMYTESSCATFPIWHKESELKMIRLSDNLLIDTSVLNSDETESYHSWSSNGRWLLFSSRRLDGRYTRLYIAAMDEEGNFGKPFLLPQKDPIQNITRLKSYNIPEFIKEEVKLNRQQITDLFNK